MLNPTGWLGRIALSRPFQSIIVVDHSSFFSATNSGCRRISTLLLANNKHQHRSYLSLYSHTASKISARTSPIHHHNNHVIVSFRSFIAAVGKGRGKYKRQPKQQPDPESSSYNKYPTTNSMNSNATSSTQQQQQSSVAAKSAQTTPSVAAKSTQTKLDDFIRKWILPVQYRFRPSSLSSSSSGQQQQGYYYYSREHAIAFLQRLPFCIAIIGFLSWDETAPYTFITIRGPSMLPTMAADRSDIWVVRKTWIWWRNLLGLQSPYHRGDLIGFAHPDHPHRISCKRIVGLPGDKVQRYGQFVHLYIEQDPDHWGISSLNDKSNDQAYKWIDPECKWDVDNDNTHHNNGEWSSNNDKKRNMNRTIIVPEGHVWIEADCPALGIDSRHFGPIPTDWIIGKVISRVWPFWNSSSATTKSYLKYKRPHPIPLDKETLMEYNVYYANPPSIDNASKA